MWNKTRDCVIFQKELDVNVILIEEALTPEQLRLSMDIAEESSKDSPKSMDGNSMLIAKSMSSEKELRVTEGLGGAMKSM